MKNIKIINVSRKYVVNKKDEFYALRNISLTFENMGFVSIVGKSGSGKSTIINLISGLDKPTEGLVKFDNINVSKLKDVKRSRYYKTKIGILFQNYNLLENEDVIFNVTLPMIMNGTSKGKAKKRAVELLKEAGIGEELFKKKTSLLSGGEKQRVALARTLANSPEVVLCDEPTGALDSENSKRVISALKEYSKSHLVIMVSHNLHIVNKYSDRIIEISDGRIKSDTYKRKNIQYQETSLNKIGNSSNWIDTISFSNFKRRFKRNLFSFFALSISLISTFVSVGFINGKDNSVNIASGKQFDFGSGSISNEEEISSGSVLTLTRTVRPTFGEMEKSKIV